MNHYPDDDYPFQDEPTMDIDTRVLRLEGPDLPEPVTCTIEEFMADNADDPDDLAFLISRLTPGESFTCWPTDTVVTLVPE